MVGTGHPLMQKSLSQLCLWGQSLWAWRRLEDSHALGSNNAMFEQCNGPELDTHECPTHFKGSFKNVSVWLL